MCLYFQIAHALHKLEHRRAEVPEGRRLYCNFPGCEFFTAHKNGLEYHVKTHKSEKDFICKTCGYSCIVKSMLESHEKSHTDQKPFECERCGYATKFRSLLNKHMKKKHGKVRAKSETGARGRAQNSRQDTDVDTVDRNSANDGVRPNFFHALYGQPFPSPQHSSPSTSSSTLSSPAQPRSFSPVPYSPISGIRSPAPSNPTMPPTFLSFSFHHILVS